jgi:NADH:ubiquinone oxidoreductase subunit F (NADH-binding)
MLEIIEKIDSSKASKNDLNELEKLSEYMEISFCALGRSYGLVIKTAINDFRNEIDERCM